jgi:transcriptional regulator with XRE-family HTH domain
LLAARLDRLFRETHPAGRGPYTPAGAAAAINAAAGENVISATYIWQLRTGRRGNPTYRHLIGLARLFGVSPAYFFPDDETRRGELPAEAARVLQDPDVRDVAMRAAGLSGHTLRAIGAVIESARAIEGLRPGSPA